MSLASFAVEKKTVIGFATALLLVAGAFSYTQLGQLEDPEFTIKTASISTVYPGASAEEVELEVADRLELAIQEMPQLKRIESNSRPGLSLIKVEILPRYKSSVLPQIWDELRRKVNDVSKNLPAGAGVPSVHDDFGDVYGFLLAVTGDGFSYAELEDHVDDLRKELSLVKGVSRVELWGVQTRCIYIDVSQARLSQLGITMDALRHTLTEQNLVVDSGGVDLPGERFRIEQTGAFKSPEDIENLIIRGLTATRAGGGDELIRIRDIGDVRRGYTEPPLCQMRYDGRPSLAMAISNLPRANIVELGQAIDKRLNELKADLPVGIEVERIAWQSDLVAESINAFMISLIEAIAIVLAVLWVSMGFRMAAIVGLGGLVFVILGSFLAMQLWGIDLQRMSLGALIIAMGMMVDNAIVVADGVLVRLQKGMDRTKAAIEAATQPSLPLLGATIIAVMAFYPIYASDEGAGEYCASLFQVVGVALLLSWVLSVTAIPLMCIWLLPAPKEATGNEDPYGGRFYQAFSGMLGKAIRFRWPVVGVMAVLLVVSFIGFGFVDRSFFPDSARLQIMIDYWAPEGTRIQTVSGNLKPIERRLLADKRVQSVSTFIGQGPPRFYLPVEPEQPYSSYAQFVVNVRDVEGLNTLIPDMDNWLGSNVPDALAIIRRYGLGPSKTWKIEARISGPSLADRDRLRDLEKEVTAAFETSPWTKVLRSNWRQRAKKVVLDYA